LHSYNDVFMQAAKNPVVTGALENILGNPLRLYGSQVFAKPALVGTVVPAHQDMPYWPFEPYEMVSAWIALEDPTLENGCVRHIAGAHKLGMLPQPPSGDHGNSLGVIDDPRLKELSQVHVEVKKASATLHHFLTLHRSR